MMLDASAVKLAIEEFIETLEADGYTAQVDVDDARVEVTVEATASACADCLIPEDTMSAVFADAIEAATGQEVQVALRYPYA